MWQFFRGKRVIHLPYVKQQAGLCQGQVHEAALPAGLRALYPTRPCRVFSYVSCAGRRPSTGQLRFLLGWAYADAAAAAARPAAFGLLRAVLARRLVLPEVYDLMARVQAAMVQAQVGPGP